MDTHLVNSQFLSKRDVRVWFFEGGNEYSGECRAVADNGVLMQVKLKLPGGSTEQDAAKHLAAVRRQLAGKRLQVELSSTKIKGEAKLEVRQVDLVSEKKKVLSVVAVWAAPPDARFLRTLLEPVVVRVPKKA